MQTCKKNQFLVVPTRGSGPKLRRLYSDLAAASSSIYDRRKDDNGLREAVDIDMSWYSWGRTHSLIKDMSWGEWKLGIGLPKPGLGEPGGMG